MTTLDERYADILTEHPDPQARRLVADLDDACAAPVAPPQVRASVAWALEQHATPRVPRARWSWRQARQRLAMVAAALVVALGGALTYLHEESPTLVSAQVVLSRAASASRLEMNQAAHITYDDSVHDTGAAQDSLMDVWLQADAQGNTALFAATQTIPRADGQVAVINRWVLAGATGQRYVYDPHANTVAIAPFSAQELSAGTGGLNIFDAPSVAAYLTQGGSAHLLPQQTLDGVAVDAIQMNDSLQGSPRQLTVYFDAQSYLLRGLDVTMPHYTLQLRVRTYDAVVASAVPAGTFALSTPPTARVVPQVAEPAVGQQSTAGSQGSSAGGSTVPDVPLPAPATVLAGVCHTTAAAVLRMALQPGGRSPLAACQTTDAGMTQAGLVTAISVTLKASLDAAVAAGTITPAEAAHRLDTIQAKLPAWVMATWVVTTP